MWRLAQRWAARRRHSPPPPLLLLLVPTGCHPNTLDTLDRCPSTRCPSWWQLCSPSSLGTPTRRPSRVCWAPVSAAVCVGGVGCNGGGVGVGV